MQKSLRTIAILTILTLAPFTHISAGWTDGGTNLYTTSEDVGIGVTNPIVELEITGNTYPNNYGVLRVTDTHHSDYERTIVALSPNMEDNNEMGIYFGKEDASKNIGEIYFEYEGDHSNDNRIAIAMHSVTGMSLFGGGEVVINSKTKLVTGMEFAVNGESYFSGNVGIGTDDPDYKLDVVGTIHTIGGAIIKGGMDIYSPATFYAGAINKGKMGYNACTDDDSLGICSATDRITFGDSTVQTRMVIADGDVGIGTDDPSKKLDVVGDVNVSGGFCIDGDCKTNWDAIADSMWTVGASDARLTLSSRRIGIGVAPSSNTKLHIYDNSADLQIKPGWYYDNDTSSFVQDNDYTTLDINGIKTLNIADGLSVSDGKMTVGYHKAPAGSDAEIYIYGKAYFTGSAYTSSDRRWKKNIRPLENSLEKIISLKGINYNWKADEHPIQNFGNDLQIGLIAQDVEAIIPELVDTDGDAGYKSIDYAKLTPVLVEAIKELKKQNDRLESRILKLESGI